jgi:hypothetical protein
MLCPANLLGYVYAIRRARTGASGFRRWFYVAHRFRGEAFRLFALGAASRERAHPVEAQGFSPAKKSRREAPSFALLFSQHVFDFSISH